MKISQCRLRILEIPFVVEFKHSTHTRSDVQTILVELELESGEIGYGEALPREYVTGESISSVKTSLLNKVFPAVKGQSFKDNNAVFDFLDSFENFIPDLESNELCVKAAFELALLDAIGKAQNISVLDLLGQPKKESIEYSGIVSAETPAVVEHILKQYQALGITAVKMKVGGDLAIDIQNIKAARVLLGDDASIRIDANEAWNLEQAIQNLPEFMEYNVVSVEQPMPAKNKQDYPKLLAFLDGRMHISLDESLCKYTDAQWMAGNKGGTVFNLRISKNGGLTNCLKLHALAKSNGIHCQLGAQVGETSLLTSAGLILAALTGDGIYNEGAFGIRLLASDITDTPLQFSKNGLLNIDKIRSLPGLGVEVNTETLEALTSEYHTDNSAIATQ